MGDATALENQFDTTSASQQHEGGEDTHPRTPEEIEAMYNLLPQPQVIKETFKLLEQLNIEFKIVGSQTKIPTVEGVNKKKSGRLQLERILARMYNIDEAQKLLDAVYDPKLQTIYTHSSRPSGSLENDLDRSDLDVVIGCNLPGIHACNFIGELANIWNDELYEIVLEGKPQKLDPKISIYRKDLPGMRHKVIEFFLAGESQERVAVSRNEPRLLDLSPLEFYNQYASAHEAFYDNTRIEKLITILKSGDLEQFTTHATDIMHYALLPLRGMKSNAELGVSPDRAKLPPMHPDFFEALRGAMQVPESPIPEEFRRAFKPLESFIPEAFKYELATKAFSYFLRAILADPGYLAEILKHPEYCIELFSTTLAGKVKYISETKLTEKDIEHLNYFDTTSTGVDHDPDPFPFNSEIFTSFMLGADQYVAYLEALIIKRNIENVIEIEKGMRERRVRKLRANVLKVLRDPMIYTIGLRGDARYLAEKLVDVIHGPIQRDRFGHIEGDCARDIDNEMNINPLLFAILQLDTDDISGQKEKILRKIQEGLPNLSRTTPELGEESYSVKLDRKLREKRVLKYQAIIEELSLDITAYTDNIAGQAEILVEKLLDVIYEPIEMTINTDVGHYAKNLSKELIKRRSIENILVTIFFLLGVTPEEAMKILKEMPINFSTNIVSEAKTPKKLQPIVDPTDMYLNPHLILQGYNTAQHTMNDRRVSLVRVLRKLDFTSYNFFRSFGYWEYYDCRKESGYPHDVDYQHYLAWHYKRPHTLTNPFYNDGDYSRLVSYESYLQDYYGRYPLHLKHQANAHGKPVPNQARKLQHINYLTAMPQTLKFRATMKSIELGSQEDYFRYVRSLEHHARNRNMMRDAWRYSR